MVTDACGKMTTSFGDIVSITASTSKFVNHKLRAESFNEKILSKVIIHITC